jgi:hypothetical protein
LGSPLVDLSRSHPLIATYMDDVAAYVDDDMAYELAIDDIITKVA